MRSLSIIALSLMLWPHSAPAQTANTNVPPAVTPDSSDRSNGIVGEPRRKLPAEYQPLTASERWKLYFLDAFGPGAILRAGALGGINQWNGTPKEWRGGAEAYGERFGSALAQHVIKKTLESGGNALLHEDDRYFRSTETGFWRRTKHAVGPPS